MLVTACAGVGEFYHTEAGDDEYNVTHYSSTA